MLTIYISASPSTLSSPAKAGDPVFQRCWRFPEGARRTGFPACAGNDTESVGPYSAGLAGVDTSVPVAACEAAALFSTIPTAMIEPS